MNTYDVVASDHTLSFRREAISYVMFEKSGNVLIFFNNGEKTTLTNSAAYEFIKWWEE